MPQESIHEFYEMVRAEKKAAFEVKAEKWYKITIEATIRPGERKTFYTYDVPDSFLNKYDWVFRWRRAKIQCLHPKLCMTQYICPYYKKEGMLFEYHNSILSKYIAAKARVTRQQKKVDEYLFSQQSSLFFNPDTPTDEGISWTDNLEWCKEYAQIKGRIIKQQQFTRNEIYAYISRRGESEFIIL